ncbi:MAG: N-terminal methylation motif domain-containing protein [Candidatus Saganbacteria bacterium]|uniref:N-terminal methylation motif domain-containing protein n=1 Tax=Candidatus Saganbacteria bacterium TaxID=2575572 RepID=A0A833KZV5_UNCSA|nr:MAG: N-terminal methylation motif domain-containing protein [Candidatus Saganbacteria bacterium]
MRKRNGFTLIEVLVVVGIIGLLMAYLVPNLLSSQDRAKEAAVKAVMHSVQLAVEAYNMENTTYPVGHNLTVKNLAVNYLLPGEYLSSVPKNPFTGVEYADSDKAGKIMYDYNDLDGKYKLEGYKRNGRSKILELSNI